MIDSRTAPYAALTLRIALGAMFIAHALLKVFVFTLPGTVQFFESLGLPGILAYVTFAAELVGGAMLVLGIGTRWVAALLIPVLLEPHGYTRPTGGCLPRLKAAGSIRRSSPLRPSYRSCLATERMRCRRCSMPNPSRACVWLKNFKGLQ